VNDILDLSKVESGKFEFFAQPVSFSVLTREVINVLHEQAASKSIRVEVHIEPDVDQLVIDPRRLKQVLYNYLSNALKFTPQGGSAIVRAQPAGPVQWRLEVEDTGIGIKPEDIGRLFAEFQQLDSGSTKAHAGTGLGLALTRRLVEAQGGSVGVRSVVGEGTVFHALLPRRADVLDPAAAADDNAVLRTSPPRAPANGRTVLVIEDDPADGRLLAEALKGAGFQVALATTAAQALELCRQHVVAAITLDLLLPDGSGLDLLADIRAQEAHRDVPVLILSVISHPQPLMSFTVTDVLSKPVDGQAVLNALSRSRVVGRHDKVVMVVDDDHRSRELMGSVLAGAGFTAAPYGRAADALAALADLRPAAVILDLAMPGLDGFEFLDRLRSQAMWRALPVIVWTSRDMNAADYNRLRDKAQAVMAKGRVDVEFLLGHIRLHVSPQ
jgi:CheY-like chemotaxis protein